MKVTNKDLASELDSILSIAKAEKGIYKFESKLFDSKTLGDILEQNGHGDWLGGNEFLIKSKGLDFLKMGGYMNAFLKQDELERLKKNNLELQNNELEYKKKLRKQESIIRLWQVISAILGAASLLLAFLL